MNKEALSHIPKSNYAYAYKENELHIRLRTAKNDMDQVYLVFGVKYDWQNKQKHPMKKILTDEYFDYYQYNIIQEDSRIGYYFELYSGNERVCYTEAGLVDEFNDTLAYCYFFQYPFINSVDVHKEPEWVKEAVFYSIFVERFYNGNVENSPANLDNWDDNPKPTSFLGGDLQGIIDQLDYLYDLGINGLYLTPIFESPSNHKYDIVNYYEIDPYFGDKKTLKELVEKAHARGIKIVLDAVFNHCSSYFPPFMDAVRKGKASEYFDWFYIDENSLQQETPSYKMFGYVTSMPKMKTSNPALKKYLLDAVRYWTTEFGIDGWRLDVSDEIDHQFWRDFRAVVKSINKEAIIIGENWHDALPWLMGDQFDSVMNYSVTKLCIDYFAQNNITSKRFEEKLSSVLIRYPDQVNEAMLNLLDSHDTERFLTTCKEDTKALKNAAAFLFGYIGIPCTYYGTEIGMDGNYDPGCRKGFDWNKEQWDMELYQYYKKLIKIRKEEPALKYGSIEFKSTDQVFIMKRSFEKQKIYVLINTTKQNQEISISEEAFIASTELQSGEVWKAEAGTVTIHVPSKTAFYIKLA